jgi:hypothetical protein
MSVGLPAPLGKGEPKTFLAVIVRDIDEQFGEGYAKEHPELVIAMLKVSTYTESPVGRILQKVDNLLEMAVDTANQAVEQLLGK